MSIDHSRLEDRFGDVRVDFGCESYAQSALHLTCYRVLNKVCENVRKLRPEFDTSVADVVEIFSVAVSSPGSGELTIRR